MPDSAVLTAFAPNWLQALNAARYGAQPFPTMQQLRAEFASNYIEAVCRHVVEEYVADSAPPPEPR